MIAAGEAISPMMEDARRTSSGAMYGRARSAGAKASLRVAAKGRRAADVRNRTQGQHADDQS